MDSKHTPGPREQRLMDLEESLRAANAELATVNAELLATLRVMFDQFKASGHDADQVSILRDVRALLARVDGGGK